MVERRVCSFCGDEIEPGTGKMYVKTDGTVFNFCSSKCQKNMLDLGRVPRRTRWSSKYEKTASSLKKEEEEKKAKTAKKPTKKKAAKKPKAKKEE